MHNIESKKIIKDILKLNSSYEICYRDKSLNCLCSACYDLASDFSTFYNNYNVVNEEDNNKKQAYVALLLLTKKALKQALYVLGIDIPEKM